MSAMVFTVALFGQTTHAAGAAGPIAVMPFKNVNQAGDIAWLEVGVAETMVSDLRRAGKDVVERDQLDRALTEIALQREVGSDASTAARLGKMVGAKTVVVGGFQRANDRLRITARFVDVETGEVRDTAKVTGALTEIFALQDAIVQRLIGRPPPKRKPRGTPKKTRQEKATKRRVKTAPPKVAKANPEKVVQAYQAFAESLQTTSPTKRVSLLRKAIALDPNFAYALDDLEALERRLALLREKDAVQRSERAKRLMKKVESSDADWAERSQSAFSVISAHLSGFYYRAMLIDARKIYRLDWPEHDGPHPKEYGSFSIMIAHNALKQFDLALQAGERHMKEFPGGQYSTAVDSMMGNIIRRRRDHEDKRSGLEAKLEKIEKDRAKDLARLDRNKRLDPDKRTERRQRINRNRDFRRCTESDYAHDFKQMMRECAAYLKTYADDPLADVNRLNARWRMARGLADQGDFEEGRRRGQAILQDDPKWAMQNRVKLVMRTWPR